MTGLGTTGGQARAPFLWGNVSEPKETPVSSHRSLLRVPTKIYAVESIPGSRRGVPGGRVKAFLDFPTLTVL